VATTTVTPKIGTSERDLATPLYHVVLLDDDDHTYDYVIEMLQALFVFSTAQAFRHAEEVDTAGRTILLTCDKPAAEFARDQVRAYGRDHRLPRSTGSMMAIIELANLN
jgi:ATP-dependent Clp protease adaptor protein ClpS